MTSDRGLPGSRSGLVVFDRVCKSYKSVEAVKDLTLTVAEGEFVTFLGPSGSGKTTSLMMLAGFETPTSGSIRLNGKPLQNVPAHKRNIGVVFQSYALFPHMTVEDNIRFPLSVRGVSGAEMNEPVARVLQLVRLVGLEHRRPMELSGGQQQRVALARALVFNPPLVLMDEPLGALDRQLREQLQQEIKGIQSELGVTLVYVTHDQSEALTMSDRVVVFKDGSVQQIANPRELYEAPHNAFVAQFIGDSNKVLGKVSHREAGFCTVELADGHSIIALSHTSAQVGGSAVVCGRPERLKLTRDDPRVTHSLRCKIDNIVYHGDHVRVHLTHCAFGQEGLFAKAANLNVDERYDVGAEIYVSWRPEDWRAFDPVGAAKA